MMLFIIVIIFLIELLRGFLSNLLKIVKNFQVKSPEDIEINKELTSLRTDLKSTSLTDEFARHMKIKRKIDHLNTLLLDKHKIRQSTFKNFESKARIILIVLNSTLIFIHGILTPVYKIDDPSWFFPFNWILSFPSFGSDAGTITLAFWLFSCKNVVSFSKKLLKINK